MSSLIWIQTVCHSDGIPERILGKDVILKKISRRQKSMQNYPVGKEITELGLEISNNVVCATSKASDQPVHMRGLIRAFASCLNIL